MKKTIVNLNEADLEAIAEMIWRNNTWFDHKGKQISLDELRNELLGYAHDRAEMCDKANGRYVAADAAYRAKAEG